MIKVNAKIILLWLTENTPGFIIGRLQARRPDREPSSLHVGTALPPLRCDRPAATRQRFRSCRRLVIPSSLAGDGQSDPAPESTPPAHPCPASKRPRSAPVGDCPDL